MLLQRFRFQLADGARVSTKVRGITLGPSGPLPMTVLPRHARVRAAPHVRSDIGRLVDFGAY
jgi:hypothetical protein